MKVLPKPQKDSGSIPIALLVMAAGLAVILAQLAGLRGSLEKTAADRKKSLAEQANNSATTTLKVLMSHEGNDLPALFPEPYVGFTPDNSDANPANDAGFRTSFPQSGADPLATFGWKMNDEIPYSTTPGSPKRYREAHIAVVNPTSSNLVSRYANATTTVPYVMSTVRAKLIQATVGNVGGISIIESMDVDLTTPNPANPAQEIKSKIRFQVPPPPAPTCTLDLIGNDLVLAANGVATSASINQLGPGASTSVVATLAPSNTTPANSVFGQDVTIMTQPLSGTIINQTQTGKKGQPPAVSFRGIVSGPQNQQTTCNFTYLTTIKLGVNFEDLADGGDMDFNDAVLCFKGKFRYTSDFVESAQNQDIEINVQNRSGCDHTMTIEVRKPDGTIRSIPNFTSRAAPNPVKITLQTGDRLLTTMNPLPCSAPVSRRKIGEKIIGGPNNGLYGVQLLKDQCNNTGN
ncbi:MAG: hypothetical protein RIQ81_983 [Pseudomonadota bacterium]|jgi:hypothetical protein